MAQVTDVGFCEFFGKLQELHHGVHKVHTLKLGGNQLGHKAFAVLSECFDMVRAPLAAQYKVEEGSTWTEANFLLPVLRSNSSYA